MRKELRYGLLAAFCVALALCAISCGKGTDLAGHWMFTNEAGDTLLDRSGHSHNGRMANVVFYRDTLLGRDRPLLGGKSLIEIPEFHLNNGNNEITVAFWVRINKPISCVFPVYKGSKDSLEYGIKLWRMPDSSYAFGLQMGTQVEPTYFANPKHIDLGEWYYEELSLGEWYHVAFSLEFGNPSSANWYFNGRFEPGYISNGSCYEKPPDTSSSLWIGASQAGDAEQSSWEIDDVRVYSRIQKASAIFGMGNIHGRDTFVGNGKGRHFQWLNWFDLFDLEIPDRILYRIRETFDQYNFSSMFRTYISPDSDFRFSYPLEWDIRDDFKFLLKHRSEFIGDFPTLDDRYEIRLGFVEHRSMIGIMARSFRADTKNHLGMNESSRRNFESIFAPDIKQKLDSLIVKSDSASTSIASTASFEFNLRRFLACYLESSGGCDYVIVAKLDSVSSDSQHISRCMNSIINSISLDKRANDQAVLSSAKTEPGFLAGLWEGFWIYRVIGNWDYGLSYYFSTVNGRFLLGVVCGLVCGLFLLFWLCVLSLYLIISLIISIIGFLIDTLKWLRDLVFRSK